MYRTIFDFHHGWVLMRDEKIIAHLVGIDAESEAQQLAQDCNGRKEFEQLLNDTINHATDVLQSSQELFNTVEKQWQRIHDESPKSVGISVRKNLENAQKSSLFSTPKPDHSKTE